MTPRLPGPAASDILRALRRAGFRIHHQAGSHATLKHTSDPSRRVIPVHARDLQRGTLRGIIKQAGMTQDEFINYL